MSESSIERAALAVLTPQARRRAAAASMLGTCVEAADIVMYAFLVVYTAPLWFPSKDPAVSVIATLGVYGVGFIARPIGGIFFGRLGDLHGRRLALILTLSMMGLATLSLGLIPSYATIGLFAPFLVLVARLAQGFAAGGEVMGAATYALESSSAGRRGLYSSMTPWGSYMGLGLATALIGLTSVVVGREAMADWGWRIPFVVTFAITGLLLLFRLRIEDSAEFLVLKRTDSLSRSPLREAWRDHRATMILTVLMGTGVLFVAYTLNVYAPVYMTTVTKLPREVVPWMVAAVFLTAGHFTPLGGMLADRVGMIRMLITMLVILGLAAIPLFNALANAQLGIVGIGFVFFAATSGTALMVGSAYQVFADIFPARVRFTAAAVGFNVANMIGAGFGPLLSAKVIAATGDPRAPGWMISIAAVLGIVGLLAILRLHRRAPGAVPVEADVVARAG